MSASTDFINECKNGAYANRLGRLTVDGMQEQINQSNYLSDFTIESGCYVDGNIVGSVYVKTLTGQLLNLPDTSELLDKELVAEVGVLYENNTSEYLNLGSYTVERPKDESTYKELKITAYDLLYSKLNASYETFLDYDSGEITVADVYEELCEALELTPKTLEFINSDIPISNTPFTNRETNLIALKSIATVACSFVTIDEDTDEIDLSWLSDSEEPEYTFELSDYSSLEGGLIEFGPVNTVILKNSQIDSENVTMQDSESIQEYGEHQIVISEDYILYNAELRQQAITAIYNRLNGLKYVDSKINCYYGKPFLKIGSKIRIYKDSESYFDTYVLKHKFTYNGTFESVIESPSLTATEIKTKQNVSLREVLRNTEIIVNKQEGTITSLTREVQDALGQMGEYTTREQVNELIQTASTGITNTFTNIGGENIFKNTGLFFENTGENSQTSPFDYWNGYLKRQDSYDPSATGTAMLIQSGTIYQELEIPNGTYTVNLKFEQLNPTAHCSVRYNGREIALEELENGFIPTTGQITTRSIKFEIICDTDDSFLIYELMGNLGTEPSTYSQNMNELRTDTVNISKGISVSSNSTNTTAKIDADGFRVINNNSGNNVLKATSTGIETPDVKANSGTIANLYFQQVGDQTWITGLGE